MSDTVADLRPSRNEMERLAKEAPEELLAMIRSDRMGLGVLTHAAEIAGQHIKTETVEPVLLVLLNHAKAIVREGAILGAGDGGHRTPALIAAITEIHKHDPSPGVRDTAGEYLFSED